MGAKFSKESITDQKRLVRGEHLLLARRYLRARDEVHHRKWRVLILAGGAPSGEINAIRALMPEAHITAVDRDPLCLEEAISAGVDDVAVCDLEKWAVDLELGPLDRGAFDLVNLDLCGLVNQTTRTIWKGVSKLLTPAGIACVTFAYGRDVVEVFVQEVECLKRPPAYYVTKGQEERQRRIVGMFRDAAIPENIQGRLCYLFTPSEIERLRSILLYRGHEMPMCSVLYVRGVDPSGISFQRIAGCDYEIAAVYPESASLYDCPQERIESFRRKFAAIRAVATRSARTLAVQPDAPIDAVLIEPHAQAGLS